MMIGQEIYLRPITTEDTAIQLGFWIKNREFLTPFYPNRSESFYTYAGQEKSIAKEIQQTKNDLFYGFGIFLKESDELIGRVNLSNIVRGAWQNSTIGYCITEGMQGRGYVTEAVKIANHFALEQIDLHRVQAAVMPRNTGSIRVLEKVGFTFEGFSRYYLQINGIWEDHRIYAITKETWYG